MNRPVLLDLFCGAGGATKGYQQAGFYVIGVDLNPQPNYCGDRFIQRDAIEVLRDLTRLGALVAGDLGRTAAVHASPPCQFYSAMSKCRPGLAAGYPDLVDPTRELLNRLGLPWVIENVVGAPLRDPVTLCGYMFGRELIRHRLFETSFPLEQPVHMPHLLPASRAGHWTPGTTMSVSGNVAPVSHARRIMDMDWTTRAELAEAIPPYYAKYVGQQLMAHIDVGAVAS